MKTPYLIIFSSLWLNGVAQAQSNSDSLARCSAEQDSLKRLLCYDRLAAQRSHSVDKVLPAKPEVNLPAPKPQRVSKAPLPAKTVGVKVIKPANKASDNFGMEGKQRPEDFQNKIYAKLSAVKTDLRKNLIFTLDNGQLWKQTDSNRIRVKKGEKIYIERGALGSFFLSKEGVNRRVRVTRVR